MDEMVRGAVAVNEAWMALGNECFETEHGTFVRNRDVPSIRDANHVSHVTATTVDEIEELVARIEVEFAGLPHRAFYIDPLTPPALEARLVVKGYEHVDSLYLLLEGELRGRPRECDVRPVNDETTWQAFLALHRENWAESRSDGNDNMIAVGEAMFRTRRSKSPPVRYWLAYEDGDAKAYFASWEGPDPADGQVRFGQVEDLFTTPESRHRGLATALIHHCVSDSRECGAGPVVIVADADDTPKQMYTALGFRPIAMKRSFWKETAS